MTGQRAILSQQPPLISAFFPKTGLVYLMKLRLCIALMGLIGLQFIGTVGCRKCKEQKYFSVIEVFLENGRIIDEEAMLIDPVASNEYIEINDYCITMTTGLEYAAVAVPSCYMADFFSFPSALASCETAQPLPTHRIQEFTVISNADFIFNNEVFVPAGTSLNSHIVVSYGDIHRIPLNEFLAGADSHPMEIPMYLFIDNQPAYNQMHRFSVVYLLDDGQSFGAATEKVILVPD